MPNTDKINHRHRQVNVVIWFGVPNTDFIKSSSKGCMDVTMCGSCLVVVIFFIDDVFPRCKSICIIYFFLALGLV